MSFTKDKKRPLIFMPEKILHFFCQTVYHWLRWSERSERSERNDSNDAFMSTVIGKPADSKMCPNKKTSPTFLWPPLKHWLYFTFWNHCTEEAAHLSFASIHIQLAACPFHFVRFSMYIWFALVFHFIEFQFELKTTTQFIAFKMDAWK